MKGELWQLVDAIPPNAVFGSLRGSDIPPDKLVRKVAIKNNDAHKIALTNITCTSPVFATELKENELGRTFELIVTAKEPLPLGNTSGSIQMSTGLKEMPVLNIPVSIYVTADVEATPSQLVFPLTLAKPMQRIVFVRNYVDGKPMKVTEVSVSNPEIKTTLTEPQEGFGWRIAVDVPQDFKLNGAGDTLTIKTDSLTVPVLTVPITQAGNMMPPVSYKSDGTAPAQSAVPIVASPVAPSRVRATGKMQAREAVPAQQTKP